MMNTTNTPNLQFLIETLMEEEPIQLSKEEKSEFVDKVRRFSEMGDSIYGKGDLQELTDLLQHLMSSRYFVERPSKLAETVHRLTSSMALEKQQPH